MSTSQQQTETQPTRRQLEAERLRLQREIMSYPAPIPACDAYFNHLLEQRAQIGEALSKLNASPPQQAL